VSVVLTVSDLAGNTDTCTAIVTVMDNEAPVAFCNDATVSVGSGGQGILDINDVIGDLTSDICGGPLTFELSDSVFSCADIGDTTITVVLTVTDTNGNDDECVASVTVEDGVTPTITCNQSFDVSLASDGSGSVNVGDLFSSASDNCGSVNVSFQSNGGATMQVGCGDIGQNLVTLVATDASGLENTCQVVVNVLDVTAPKVVCMDATATLVGGVATITTADIDAGSSDECGCIDTMMLDQDTFTAPGTYPVVLTVFDCNGNSDTCSANVVVTTTGLIEVGTYAFLEGAYDFNSGEMTTHLNTGGHIPLAQPYNIPGYYYGGGETLASVPADMVDWVLVRLYDGAAMNVLLGEAAGVLMKDGSIMDANGGFLQFAVTASTYRIEIHHWSALPISSPGGLAVDSTGVLIHDFRSDMSSAMVNGTYVNTPMSDLFTGDYGMTAGNALYIDAFTDLNDIGWAYSEFGTFGRSSSDVNLDGAVDLIDIQIIFFNLFKFSHIP
ncbi:MAG: HYR domain-containing protein, partial [Bacteroidota bacterium]